MRADDQRDRDREAGDGDVVVDLADRLGERPAVGEVHERAVDGVQQAHAGREQDRQARGSRRTAARTPRRRRPGRAAPTSVAVSKPRPNSTPIGYICHGLVTDFVGAAEEAVHEAALVELLLQLPPRRTRRAASAGTPGRCRPARPG